MKTLDFLARALKNLKTIGTFFASSSAAARKMTEPVDFKNARVIIELGGGTGAITKEILQRMHVDAKLYVFEIYTPFVEDIRKISDQRLEVIQDSAEHLEQHLKDLGIEKVDAVISTLPLVIFKEDTRNIILDSAFHVLKPKGVFTQIQYSLMTIKEMKKKFKFLKINFTLFNIPPAFIYIVKKN